mmetsp:Transcript_11301/g.23136  ORF Transcript_11301/g.23136 Transcript_11301/m.23136 type:complete len:148 (+) Transcript_11301:367-810(+)
MFISMKSRFVSTSTVDFGTGVDSHRGFVTNRVQDCHPLLSTQFACVSAKGFDAADWVALPDDLNLHFTEVVDFFSYRSFGYERGEMGSKGVRRFALDNEAFNILDVLLDAGFDFLLSVADVVLAGQQARCFVDHNRRKLHLKNYRFK